MRAKVLFLSISMLSIIFACGRQSDSALKTSDANAAESLVFKRDDRPVDGALIEITLKKLTTGKYEGKLKSARWNWQTGSTAEDVRELGGDLTCKISDDSTTCFADRRPVDGVLTELKIFKNSSGSYDATLRTAGFDRRIGQSFDKTETIAERLARQ